MSRCLENCDNLLNAEQDLGDHRESSWALDQIETGLEGSITVEEGILFAKGFIDPYCLPYLLNTHAPPWCCALSSLVICSTNSALLPSWSVQVSMPLVLLWMPSAPAVSQCYVLHVETHGCCWSTFLEQAMRWDSHLQPKHSHTNIHRGEGYFCRFSLSYGGPASPAWP